MKAILTRIAVALEQIASALGGSDEAERLYRKADEKARNFKGVEG